MESAVNKPLPELISGRRLAKNTLWNLLGQVIPLLAALVAIPYLIAGLGTDKFGVLALAWLLVGYFNLFDLGLGRALTRTVADRLGAERARQNAIAGLFWTALALMSLLGGLGTLTALGLAPWLAYQLFQIPDPLRADALSAFYLLGGALFIVISTAPLRGMLAAYQYFGWINLVRVPVGALFFLGPLLALAWSDSLVAVVAALVVVRVLNWAAYLALCLWLVPALRRRPVLNRALAAELIRLGSWMTVSNIISPLMVYMDRLLIGAAVSMTALTYYTTPYEVITKFWIVSGALVGVLFPAFATAMRRDRARAAKLFERGALYVYLALFPAALIAVSLAEPGLALWLGPDFAERSAWVLKCLAVGVFINSLVHIPSAFIQGAGRPDLAAKTHLVELPFYAAALWYLSDRYGINGVALAWTLRVAIDAVAFYGWTVYLLPTVRAPVRRLFWQTGAAVAVLVSVALVDGSPPAKGLLLTAGLALFGILAWRRLLIPEERLLLKRALRPKTQ